MSDTKDVNDRDENYDPETGEFVFLRCFSCESIAGREVNILAWADPRCLMCGCDVPQHLKREPDHD